jgi:hypothetical protein
MFSFRELLPPLLHGALAAFAVVVLGCSNPADPDDEPTDEQPEFPTDYADPDSLLDAHARALTRRNVEGYLALLEKPSSSNPGFEFCVRDADLAYIPWLREPCWDYEVEADIIRNMRDPDFVPESGFPTHVAIALEITEASWLSENLVTLDCNSFMIVDGSRSISRFDITLIRDERGFLRIRRMADLSGTSTDSLGRIKSRYRSPG